MFKAQTINYTKPRAFGEIATGNRLAQGLIACWPFTESNGKKSFSSLTKNKLTITPGNGNVFQWKNGGLFLDGTAYGVVTSPDSLRLFNQDFSIVTRIYSYLGTGKTAGIVDKDNSSNGWGFWIDGSAGNNFGHFWTGAGNDFITAQSFPNNTWGQVAATYKIGGSVLTQYMNGQKDIVTNAVSAITNSTGVNLNIGNARGSTFQFAGIIDLILIYNRALLSEEIYQLYNQPYAFLRPKA